MWCAHLLVRSCEQMRKWIVFWQHLCLEFVLDDIYSFTLNNSSKFFEMHSTLSRPIACLLCFDYCKPSFSQLTRVGNQCLAYGCPKFAFDSDPILFFFALVQVSQTFDFILKYISSSKGEYSKIVFISYCCIYRHFNVRDKSSPSIKISFRKPMWRDCFNCLLCSSRNSSHFIWQSLNLVLIWLVPLIRLNSLSGFSDGFLILPIVTALWVLISILTFEIFSDVPNPIMIITESNCPCG